MSYTKTGTRVPAAEEPADSEAAQPLTSLDRIAEHHRVSVDPARDVLTGIPDPWANLGARDIPMDPPRSEPGDMEPV